MHDGVRYRALAAAALADEAQALSFLYIERNAVQNLLFPPSRAKGYDEIFDFQKRRIIV